jgi:hypothetical protein
MSETKSLRDTSWPWWFRVLVGYIVKLSHYLFLDEIAIFRPHNLRSPRNFNGGTHSPLPFASFCALSYNSGLFENKLRDRYGR